MKANNFLNIVYFCIATVWFGLGVFAICYPNVNFHISFAIACFAIAYERLLDIWVPRRLGDDRTIR